MKVISVIPLCLIFLTACNGRKCAPIEKKIMQICETTDSVYVIPLQNVADFEWAELYIVSGPSFPEEVKEYTGLNYKALIPDDQRQYIFISENKIVKEFSSTCMNIDLHPLHKDKSYVKFFRGDSIQMQKRFNENRPYYEAIPW